MDSMPAFVLKRPTSVAEAAELLAGDPQARLLAGGTDLVPNMRRGIARPSILIDLGEVTGLDAVTFAPEGTWIGARLRLAQLASDASFAAAWPAITQAAGSIAGPGHRSAATVGGNLCLDTRCVFYNQSDWWRSGNGYCLKYRGDKCHVVVKSDRCYATYHGDVAPALMVLDARAEIAGPGGVRSLPVAALFVEDGQRRLTLGAGEWLVAVVVPPAAGWRAGYAKARVRDAVDFPLAGAAVALRRDGDRLAGLRVAITGTNSAPLAVPTDAVVGRPWDAEAAQALTKAVQATGNVLATTVATVRYRRRMMHALVRRLVDDLWASTTNGAAA